jgi:hypothetical protein
MPTNTANLFLLTLKPMKLFTTLAFALAAFALPVQAQSDSQLTRQFKEGFERGCNQLEKSGVKNQRGYCRCMANSYGKRYSGQELAAISNSIAVLGDNGPAIVNLMMGPETRMCSAKN